MCRGARVPGARAPWCPSLPSQHSLRAEGAKSASGPEREAWGVRACGGCCGGGPCTVEKSRMEGGFGAGPRRAQWPELRCLFRAGRGAGSRGSRMQGWAPRWASDPRRVVLWMQLDWACLRLQPKLWETGAPGTRLCTWLQGFESWLCHLLPMWLSPSRFNLCVPQVLQIENGTNTSHPFPWVALRIKHMDIAAVPGTDRQHCVFVKHKVVTRAAHRDSPLPPQRQ